MFSGLVADLGQVEQIETDEDGARIAIKTGLAGQIETGDSVAVNGVCLTATEVTGSGFSAEAMTQTLNLTSLGNLAGGTAVNLELALRADQRLGGHIVQGHVDGVGQVSSLTGDGFSLRVRVALDDDLARYVVPQGSITLEGVSLTVTECGPDWAEVALIPETRERTTLGSLDAGRRVNVECDVIAKYVERMVSPYASPNQPAESEQK
ncbi:MAG: riboflavin synthase [Solirubrobacterales bacterium]